MKIGPERLVRTRAGNPVSYWPRLDCSLRSDLVIFLLLQIVWVNAHAGFTMGPFRVEVSWYRQMRSGWNNVAGI
jgi:hypothetical protein